MDKNFECDNTKCMAHNGTACMWTYEDKIDIDHPKVCPHIKELLRKIRGENMEFEDLESNICKTGNGECGYKILPNNLCGCNPGKYGGYMDCDIDNCPLQGK